MPIYEYECAGCGETFEAIRRFSDPPLESCTECSAPNPRKLVSAAAFHLKGSGWYATDYGRPKQAGEAKPGKAEEEKAEPKASTSPAEKSAKDQDKKAGDKPDKKAASA